MSKIYFIREKHTKFGGAEVYLSRLCRALDKVNISYQIIHSIFPKFLPSWLRVILFNLQVCLAKSDKFYFSLERILCPDIYRAGDGVHKVFLKIEHKSKINPLHPVYLFLEKRCFNNAKRIIANSKMIKHEIISTYGIDSSKIDVVYNGIEHNEYNYERSFDKLSKEFKINKYDAVLLYVGNGFKRKGVEDFLNIVSLLQHKNVKAFVVGKEKKISYYRQLSRLMGVDKKVIFTGPRKDVDDFYIVSDIFILPTHYDPFSNVILEAMSFENAVFTTRQNGASEIIGKNFIMKSPDDLSIIASIDSLLDNPASLQGIKQTNKLKSNEFSINNNLKNTLKVVKDVLNAK